jgi:hypothetical protein
VLDVDVVNAPLRCFVGRGLEEVGTVRVGVGVGDGVRGGLIHTVDSVGPE